MKSQVWVFSALTGAIGFLLALVILRTNEPGSYSPRSLASNKSAPPMVVQTAPADQPASKPGVDFAEVAARVNNAVVNVDAAARRDRNGAPRWRRDLDDPSAPREGTGSGFIIDPAGYVLTNFHVIDGADRITVTLGDGRAFRADIAGVDPALDIALIKISGPDPFPAAVLGDSSTLRVGEWVCAIGNPLGYVHSVTVGVISFLGRKLFDQTLDAYIQTDAAISLGNSGGPLIDRAGRVIGITTAVSSQAANIGFAIPISQVVAVLPQLKERGRVSRGFSGMSLTRVTPSFQRALGLGSMSGALVQHITIDTPAERAGLRLYDVVIAADGRGIASDEELINYIAAGTPGTQVALEVLRDTKRLRLILKLGERPLPPSILSRLRRTDAQRASLDDLGPLGMTVRELDPASALRRALPDSVQGVAVVDVDPAGPARLARIRPGQIVLEVNRRPTHTALSFDDAVRALGPGRTAVLLIYDPITDQRLLVGVEPDR